MGAELLLPVDLRYSVPSFYFWDFERYLSYLPNVVWVLAAVLLLITGFMWSTPRRNRLRIVWSVAVALAAFVLPVQPTADSASRTDRTRAEEIVRSVRSDTRNRFEAERMSPRSDSTTIADVQASGGAARASRPAHESGYAVFGPWIDLDPGAYRAQVALRLRSPTEVATAARFDVRAAGNDDIAFIEVPATRLTGNRYATFSLSFETDEVLRRVELRVRAHPNADVLVDYVDLVPLLP